MIYPDGMYRARRFEVKGRSISLVLSGHVDEQSMDFVVDGRTYVLDVPEALELMHKLALAVDDVQRQGRLDDVDGHPRLVANVIPLPTPE